MNQYTVASLLMKNQGILFMYVIIYKYSIYSSVLFWGILNNTDNDAEHYVWYLQQRAKKIYLNISWLYI